MQYREKLSFPTHLQILLPEQLHELGVVLCEERLGVLLALDGFDQGVVGPEEHDADVDPFLRRERLWCCGVSCCGVVLYMGV